MFHRARLSRRRLVQGVVGLGGAVAGPTLGVGCGPTSLGRQQPAKVPRVGILSLGTAASTTALLDAFRGGLRELGYVEGRNIALVANPVDSHPY